MLKSSLIISTYNWSEALDLVLKSALLQSELPNEIIIADDGSTDETKTLIALYTKKSKIPIIHIWHKDKGFKKAEILNKAIAKAQGQYIIQVDGDCIMHRNFVKDHISFSRKGQYLHGSRVNIQKYYLETLFKNRQVDFKFYSKGIKKRTRAMYIPFLSNFYKKKENFSSKYRGCNTSFFKSDFLTINGYNERFEGWGREDSELAIRFHNLGLFARRLRFKGIVFHIYHPEKSKNRLELNNYIEQKTIKDKTIKTEKGINQYL